MTVLLLARHGVTDLTGKKLYGRSADVHLSEEGRRQGVELGRRLAPLKPAALYTSPIERCLETAELVGEACGMGPTELPEVMEVDYGKWTGRSFASLARTRLWRRVHRIPSGVRFPGGETLAEVQRRVVGGLGEVAERHPRGLVVVVSHGDPIAMALAHYAGVHIDLFQRIQISPGSVSAVALDEGPPKVLRVNDTGSLEDLRPRR